MRVTTERAQSAIKAHHITGNLTNIVKDYAADLLEAREFIEKQAEFIKEMRECIVSLRSMIRTMTFEKTATVYQDKELDVIIEKTKRYAE